MKQERVLKGSSVATFELAVMLAMNSGGFAPSEALGRKTTSSGSENETSHGSSNVRRRGNRALTFERD